VAAERSADAAAAAEARLASVTLGDLEAVRLLLRGGSVIDWHRLDLRDHDEVDRFLRVNELDPTRAGDVERLETLRAANDQVSNALAAFPIFRHYDLDGHLHSSSDGQKFETRIATINARHSPKYFGLKKGVVAYSMVANHVPVNAQIIGANEHESHYVFDILIA